MMTAAQPEIRTEPHPNCQLCGGVGVVLYEGLKDRLFDVPGIWSFRRCSNPACQHVWLDPQPFLADLPLIYEDYYTHGSIAEETPLLSAPRQHRRLFRFGYEAFVRLSGLARERKAAYEMYLGNRPPGRLLEIGCGSGERLAYLAAKGWNVQGQDVDAKAVAHARESTALPVHLGPIESLPESAGPFDAVVMNHVIEHVHDPVALLRQAAALLAPGGVLVAVTPNIDSLGHRWFGRAWLHLDPPRHLHLFSPRMLKEAAGHAHLRNTRVMTSAAHVDQAAMGSRNIARGENAFFGAPPTFVCMAASALIQAAAWFYHALDRTKGDECVLIATAEREPIDPAASDENDHAVRAGHGAL